MSQKISIRTDSIAIDAELIDSKTLSLIWESLPLQGTVNTWGLEIYFSIPVIAELENGREVVSSGDIAYWPPGKAFCIFFGPTPASHGNEIRAASKVNVFGRLASNPDILRQVKDGEKIFIEKSP